MSQSPSTQAPNAAEAIRSLDTDEVLTDEVLGQLAEAIGQTTLDELGSMQPWQIKQLVAPNMVGVDGLGRIASALLAALRNEGYLAAPAAPVDTTSVAGSLNVQVVTPPKPNEMTVRQLLEALIEDPSRYADLITFINATGAVKAAAAKTPNWVVMRAEGGIDIDATLAYLEQLRPEFAKAQRSLQDGRRPITLARAFGQQERAMIHPFTLEPVTGPDELRFDFGALDDTLHKALIWAQVMGHELWPTNLDRFDASTEVFQSPLPNRWQQILNDYLVACQEDEGNVIPSRYYTNDLLASIKQSKAGGAAPFGGSTAEPVRDDSWYRERLEEVAQSAISASASSVRRSRAVIVSVSASGGSISLSDVIVLGNVRASMGSVSGTIYFPPGKGASADMGSMGATTYNRTWKQLYQLAVKWGLIEETPAPAGNGGKYNVTVIGSTGVTIGDHQ